jgi:Flp pilus assembly protein TadG
MKLLALAKTKTRHASKIRNSRGNAMVETLPMIIIFVIMLAFGIGFFTVVHTAIMNSIGARTYAFETFRNRSDVTYFRDALGEILQYADWGNRIHTISSEKDAINGTADNSATYATARNLAFGQTLPALGSTADHNTNIYNIVGRNRQAGGVQASPAWVMVAYGICLDANCGDGAP